MSRTLVKTEAEVVALLVKELAERDGPEAIENMLGIEFAFQDGRFQSELEQSTPEDGDWSWDGEPVDFKTYQHNEDRPQHFPMKYPAYAVYCFDDDYDRCGRMQTRILRYAYPNKNKP